MKILLVILTVVFLYALFELFFVGSAVLKGRSVVAAAEPFTRDNGPHAPRVLVIGDSTGYGTGADIPEESVAGRLGVAYPHVTIQNASVNGLRTEGLLRLLQEIPEETSYKLILINIGGNDILNFVSTNVIHENLVNIFEEATQRSEYVAVMSTGNVGVAPGFGPLLSYAYTAKTKEVREVFLELSTQYDSVLYVDLFRPRSEDVFAQDPLRYHAIDGVHPSSDGYAEWYESLERVLEENDVQL